MSKTPDELRPGDMVVRWLCPQAMVICAIYGDFAWCTYMRGAKKFTEYHMLNKLFFVR